LADVTQLRFAQQLKRALGLKAVDPGRSVNPTIAATYGLGDKYAPETRADRGERSFSLIGQFTNTSAVNFGAGAFENPLGSGKLIVVRRFTWNLNLPTATNQPGEVSLGYIVTNTLTGAGISANPGFKDGRVTAAYGLKDIAIGFNGFTTGTSGFTSVGFTWGQVLFPQAATVVTTVVTDEADVVLGPGSAARVQLISSVRPAATYNWNVVLEGFIRTADQGELLPPPL